MCTHRIGLFFRNIAPATAGIALGALAGERFGNLATAMAAIATETIQRTPRLARVTHAPLAAIGANPQLVWKSIASGLEAICLMRFLVPNAPIYPILIGAAFPVVLNVGMFATFRNRVNQ